MPFQKGNRLGNRKGRLPKGESLAELVRAEAGKDGKQKMVKRMWNLATQPHDRPDLAIKAADWCADRGWPDERKGAPLQLQTDSGQSVRRVIFELTDADTSK